MANIIFISMLVITGAGIFTELSKGAPNYLTALWIFNTAVWVCAWRIAIHE